MLSRFETGTFVEPSKQTLGRHLTEWLVGLRASGLKHSTISGYEMLATKHVIPRLGATPLQKLTVGQLNALYADLLDHGRLNGKGKGGSLSPSTVKYVHATIRKALGDAVEAGVLARNVAERARPPRPEARTRPATWTAGELRAFLAHVAGDRLYALYHLAASTGLRRGEVLGLRWRDVDLDVGRVSISETIVTVEGKVETSTPKTKHGSRSVALDAGTVRVMRAHRKRQVEERLALGGYAEDRDLVFCGLDGRPLHPSDVSKRFDRLVRSSGLPRIRFHDLRHSHATLALQAGVHPKVVSERLGHSDIAITLNTYSHAIPAMEADAAEKVAQLVAVAGGSR